MHNKTFLSSVDTERKRLIKVDLSSINELNESINQLEQQISDLRTVKKNVEDFDNDVRDVADEFMEAFDNLRDKGTRLERITNEYVQRLDEAEQYATTLRDLYENKTEDVAKEFAKNAVALGINPDAIPEYDEIIELNEDAQDVVSDTLQIIELSDDIIDEATRLINENNL